MPKKSKPKPKKQGKKGKNTGKHGRRVMITTDDDWIFCRFEFDSDGSGVVWQQGCSIGPNETVEKCTKRFEEKGYTLVEWKGKLQNRRQHED